MSKMNFFGAGPKIGAIALPWLAASIIITLKFRNTFAFFKDGNRIMFYAGIAVLVAGLIFYFITVPSLLKGLKESRLVKTGTFSLCCNPLYAAIILMIVPGMALIMNSWLVLTTSIAGYLTFKAFIKSEYNEMESIFGEDYRKYRSETPEFFPFPVRKLIK